MFSGCSRFRFGVGLSIVNIACYTWHHHKYLTYNSFEFFRAKHANRRIVSCASCFVFFFFNTRLLRARFIVHNDKWLQGIYWTCHSSYYGKGFYALIAFRSGVVGRGDLNCMICKIPQLCLSGTTLDKIMTLRVLSIEKSGFQIGISDFLMKHELPKSNFDAQNRFPRWVQLTNSNLDFMDLLFSRFTLPPINNRSYFYT